MFDAILLASYGGPEGRDDVEPFLDRILSKRPIPPARRTTVVEHYLHFDGVSPLPGECRQFIASLQNKIARSRRPLRVYWGNLYAPPFIDDAFEKLERDEIQNVLVLASSAFGSVAGCRRYIDAVQKAAAKRSPEFVEKLVVKHVPPFFETPAFHISVADTIRDALATAPKSDENSQRLILFSAHSIPATDSNASQYRRQLLSACVEALRRATTDVPRRVDSDSFPSRPTTFVLPETQTQIPDALRAKLAPQGLDAALAFQSRSGSPAIPWIGPDIEELLRDFKAQNPALTSVLVVPIGFFFDNMETVYDLDVELGATCDEIGVTYDRVPCCGTSDTMVDAALALALKSPEEFPICHCCDGACDLSCRLNPFFLIRR
ncbi:MAG: ferrochelatase [Thermoguttaceae bacterium]|jgi:ferrochelatase